LTESVDEKVVKLFVLLKEVPVVKLLVKTFFS